MKLNKAVETARYTHYNLGPDLKVTHSSPAGAIHLFELSKVGQSIVMDDEEMRALIALYYEVRPSTKCPPHAWKYETYISADYCLECGESRYDSRPADTQKEKCNHNLEIKLVSHVEHVCGKCGFTLGEGVCEHDWQSTLRDTSRCRHCHMWWEELGEERG